MAGPYEFAILAESLGTVPGSVPPLPEAVHFARLTVLPRQPGGPVNGILFAAVSDRPAPDLVKQLLACQEWLAVFSCWKEFPADSGQQASWMLAMRLNAVTQHIGTVRMTVEQIISEEKWRQQVALILDKRPNVADGWSEIRTLSKEFPQGPSTATLLLEYFQDVLNALGVPLWLVLALAVLSRFQPLLAEILGGLGVLWLLTLAAMGLWQNQARLVDPKRKPVEVERRRTIDLEMRETKVIQAVTLYAPLRPSWVTRPLIHLILYFANLQARILSRGGKLTGIETIHFARFYLVEHKYILFLSDYDGTWRQYLQDFLTTGSLAVIPTFHRLEDCPPFSGLFKAGRGFAADFMAFVRKWQHPEEFNLQAYPDLTVVNILATHKKLEAVYKTRGTQWLKNF